MYIITAGIITELLAIHAYLGIPSIYRLLRGFDVAKKLEIEAPERTRRRMWIVYISSLVFVVLFISMAFASQFNAIFAESTFVRDLIFIAYLSGGVVLIIYLAVHYMHHKKKEAPAMQRRQTPEEVARKIMIWASFAIAGVLGVIGILMYMGTMKPIPLVGKAAITSIDMIVASLLIGLGPYGFSQSAKMKRTSQMDAKFPDFLRDLSESKRAGMTLTNALLTTAKGRYGALTGEIRKMASQITWGVSFVEALRLFGERVRTPLIGRSVSLIIEASNSGGNVVEILKAAADDAREIKQIQAERKQNMGIYVIIIYLAFMVFIAVIEIMYSQFIPQIHKAVSGASGASVGGMTFTPFDIETYKTLFFHAALIQGVGGGLISGVMEEGKAIMGLRHAFIMVIIAYLAFRFVVV
jgi:flagellar protein FlaJ